MSKAFTREADDLPERPASLPRRSLLPPGAKNYITPNGMLHLRREWEQLMAEPSSASTQRVAELRQILQSAVMVEPPAPPWNQVLFGATATVRNQRGEHLVYRIVGVDETEMGATHVSWLSPVAKALLKRQIGDQIRLRTPDGDQNLEIVAVHFDGK